jgi:DNA-binding MarR family transcriptional regulator
MPSKFNSLNLADVHADLQAFDNLERVIHEKGRLAVVSVLAAAPADRGLLFTEIRDALRLTDGNLACHLRALDEAGYIHTHRQPGKSRRAAAEPNAPGKPVTRITLTASGRAAFRRYLDALEQIVKRHK